MFSENGLTTLSDLIAKAGLADTLSGSGKAPIRNYKNNKVLTAVLFYERKDLLRCLHHRMRPLMLWIRLQ